MQSEAVEVVTDGAPAWRGCPVLLEMVAEEVARVVLRQQRKPAAKAYLLRRLVWMAAIADSAGCTISDVEAAWAPWVEVGVSYEMGWAVRKVFGDAAFLPGWLARRRAAEAEAWALFRRYRGVILAVVTEGAALLREDKLSLSNTELRRLVCAALTAEADRSIP